MTPHPVPTSPRFFRIDMTRAIQALLACLVLGFLVSSDLMAQKKVIKVSDQIYDGKGGPFLNNKVYWITGPGALVPKGKTLSVGPGATVKLDSGGLLTVSGTLNSNGASWTSIHDDAISGDSNGNGTKTTPAPGDWNGITFGLGSEKSVFHSNLIRFAGRKGHTATLWVRSAKSVTITKNLIDLSATMGINWEWSKSIIKDNSILRCKGVPMQGVVIGLAGISNNIAKYNTPGNYVRVWHHSSTWPSGNLTLSPDQTPNKTGVIVVASRSILGVPTGGRLTIPAGMILKFEKDAGLSTRGQGTKKSTIYFNGTRTNPIHLTSIADDTVGGDTNNDGKATVPKPGDWKNVSHFQPGKSLYNYVHLRFGGANGVPLVHNTWGGAAKMMGSWFQTSGGDGIQHAPFLGSLLELTDCVFSDLVGIPVNGIGPESLALASGNSAVRCKKGNHMALTQVDITKNLTIGPENYTGTVLLSLGMLWTKPGGSLTLRPGTRIKFGKSRGVAFFRGSMQLVGTAQRPIILTSIHDDSIGGDTDRSNQAPAPGDWNGIDARSLDARSRVRHVLVRYANTGVRCSSKRTTIESVRCDYTATAGMNIQTMQGALENAVIFTSNGSGIVAANLPLEIRHATVTRCKLGGINVGVSFPGNIRNSISWGNTTNNFGTVLAKRIWNSNGASAGKQGNINADPKFMNVAKGDLRLAANSPCLNRADTTVAVLTANDFTENSRIIDHDLSGSSLPDMGAYERAVWFTVASGPAWLGRSIGFKTTGAHVSPSPAGVSVYFLGAMDIRFPWSNFGMELVGLAGLTVMGTANMDNILQIPIPNNMSLDGITIGIQPLNLSTAVIGRGHFGTLYRSTLRIAP